MVRKPNPVRPGRHSRFHALTRGVAVALIAGLVGLSPATASANDANLSGRVMSADASTPVAGVVVHLVDDASQEVFSSARTDATGDFALEAPAGDGYRLLAEQPDGTAFLAAEGVQVVAGNNAPVMLALQDGSTGTPAATGPKSGWERYGRWILVGGLVIAGAFIIDDLNDDDDLEPVGTPMSPGGDER